MMVETNLINYLPIHVSLGGDGDTEASFSGTQKVTLVFKNTCPRFLEFNKDIRFEVMGEKIEIKKFSLNSNQEKRVEVLLKRNPEKRGDVTGKISAALTAHEARVKSGHFPKKAFAFSLDKPEVVLKIEIYEFCEDLNRGERLDQPYMPAFNVLRVRFR